MSIATAEKLVRAAFGKLEGEILSLASRAIARDSKRRHGRTVSFVSSMGMSFFSAYAADGEEIRDYDPPEAREIDRLIDDYGWAHVAPTIILRAKNGVVRQEPP